MRKPLRWGGKYAQVYLGFYKNVLFSPLTLGGWGGKYAQVYLGFYIFYLKLAVYWCVALLPHSGSLVRRLAWLQLVSRVRGVLTA